MSRFSILTEPFVGGPIQPVTAVSSGPVIGSTITTATVRNGSVSAALSQVFSVGQSFRRGDMPTGTYPALAVADPGGGGSDLSLTYQMDQATYWDDNSLRYGSFKIQTGTTPGTFTPSGLQQIKFKQASGTYSASGLRSLADIQAQQYQLQLTDPRDHSGNALTSDMLVDLNTLITDGIIDRTSTGSVCDSWTIHGAALFTSPVTATLAADVTTTAQTAWSMVATVATTATFIGKIGSEYVLVTSKGAGTNWTVTRGAMRSTKATYPAGTVLQVCPHVWVRWYFDVYSKADGTLYGISHIAHLMLPWLNVAGGDLLSYRAQMVSNAGISPGTITHVASPTQVSFTQNTTTVKTSAGSPSNSIQITGAPYERCECFDVSVTGVDTLPTGLAAGTPYFARNVGTTYYSGYTDPSGPGLTGTGLATISAVGSGTLTVTKRAWHNYRCGWWTAADDLGNRLWTTNGTTAPQITPAFTTTERSYWQSTGAIPPYDTTLSPNSYSTAVAVPGICDTLKYRVSCAVAGDKAIGAPGDPPHQGPLPQWDVCAWLRQTSTDWGYTRAAALGKSHWPWVTVLSEVTGYIQPFNNGTSNSGAAYSNGLGTPQPQWCYNGLGSTHVNGILTPANGASYANFNGSGGSGENPSLGHWPLTPYLAYLVSGERHFLDGMYFDANVPYMVWQTEVVLANASSKRARINNVGTTYTKISFGTEARGPTTIKASVTAAAFGPTSDPEQKLCIDNIDNELAFWTALAALAQPAGWDTIGAMDAGSGGYEGLTSWWGSYWYIYGKALLRDRNFSLLTNRIANHFKGRWDETVSGSLNSYYGPYEYRNNFQYPQNAVLPSAWNGSYITNFATTWDSVGVGPSWGAGGGFNVLAGDSYIYVAAGLQYNTGTHTFTAGQTVTGATSGATATVAFDNNSGANGRLWVYGITGTFSSGETLTDPLGGSAKFAGSTGSYSNTGFVSDFNLQNGDKFKCTDPAVLNGSAGSSFTGPTELNPLTVQEWFYIRDLTASGGYVRFRLAQTPGGAVYPAAGFASSSYWSRAFGSGDTSVMAFTVRPAYAPATSVGVVNNSGWGLDPKGYGAVHLGLMQWMKSVGITGLDGAITNATARVQCPQTGATSYTSNPKYRMTYQPVT